MSDVLPRWLMERYLALWDKFKEKQFGFEAAQEFLGDDSRIISIFLSELKKNGWLEVKLDPIDSRKRLYKLRPYSKVLEEVAKNVVKELKRS